MAHVTVDRFVPMSPVVADPCRQEVSFMVAVQFRVTLKGDEARRWGDEWAAAVALLAVKDSDGAQARGVNGAPAEVDRG